MGWLAVGALAAGLIFATPLLVRATSVDSGYGASPFLSGLAWAAALTAPTSFVLLGLIRLVSAATNVRGRTRHVGPVHAMAGRLPRSPRHVGGRWEAPDADGAWRPIENPLERAARNADGLRRFLEAEDIGFVVRVYPVVTSGSRAGALGVERTGACPVVPIGDVPGWLAALPAQRSLGAARLQRVREILEGLVAA